MNWLRFLFVAAVLSISLVPAFPAGPDSEYVEIFHLIKRGDDLSERGQSAAAVSAYQDALEKLGTFRDQYKTWNPSVVRFRTSYVTEQLERLDQGVALERPVAQLKQQLDQSEASRTALDGLKGRITQLEAERGHLEARLTEALKAQPAAVDPRELEKAEEQIAQLTKEKALIQAQLATSETEIESLQAKTIDSGVLEAADKRISEQSDQIAMLELEKVALQRQLETIRDRNSNQTGSSLNGDGATIKLANEREEAESREALLEAANRIAQFETEMAQMRNLRVQLEQRVATFEAANIQLTAEKAALQTELTSLRTQLATGVDVAGLTSKLASAREQIELARLENEQLKAQHVATRAENEELKQRIDQLEEDPSVQENRELKLRASSSEAEILHLRDELVRIETELQRANQQVAKKSKTEDRSKVVALGNEISLLESRLAVLQAQQIPYSEAELALIETATADVAAPKSQPSHEEVRRRGLMSLPAGSSELISEGQRAFAQGRLPDAEARYREVLALQEDNVFSLSNLAAVLIELDKLAEAETLVERALEIDPEDGYSQTLRGMIKFRNGDMDAAIDSLSKAAIIDPNDPQAQNYLGIALSQKGLRKPAEAALRKAVALSPAYASAHYNLALVYLTQEPKFPKLAEYHYQLATSGGHPPNEELEQMFNN